MKADLVR